MCGICGIIDTGRKTPPSTLKDHCQRMNAAMFHRGPDGEGLLAKEHLALAMRRLAIIDLAGGQQPLWNQRGTACVFLNGEIYNHADLRAQLQQKGIVFKSHSDTEVIIHLYEAYGTKLLDYLRGMFAFCIYDSERDCLFLARDRFGEKPLFYHFDEGVFSFASEPAALLENPAIPRKLNREALPYYLAAGYVPEPLTLLEGVHTLPPGHSLVLENAKITIAPYFKIKYPRKQEQLISDPEAAKRLIEPALRQAVRRQLVSDVPVGAFLSGGIDSSTVCALAQQESQQRLDTFTVRFEEASYDESRIASEVAKRIGSHHHTITVPNEEFSDEMFWTIIDQVGLPFPDSSAIPVFLISREIRKHVTVALSGDGGDEVFGGYPDLDWFRKIVPLTQLPPKLLSGARQLVSYLPLSADRTRQLSRALQAASWGKTGLSFGIHRLQFENEIASLLGTTHHTYPLQTTPPDCFQAWSPLRQAMYYRLNHKLVTDMLIKVDRMSMANSLEVRAPFLDPDLFELSLRLDDSLLYHQSQGKVILRQMMKDYLPAEVFDHPKQGFSIPLHKYQNGAYRALSDELLGPISPLNDFLNPKAIKAISQSVFAGSIDRARTTHFRNSHRHWALMLLAGWMQRFSIER